MYIYRVYTWTNGIKDFKNKEDMNKWIEKNWGIYRYWKKICVYEENE